MCLAFPFGSACVVCGDDGDGPARLAPSLFFCNCEVNRSQSQAVHVGRGFAQQRRE